MKIDEYFNILNNTQQNRAGKKILDLYDPMLEDKIEDDEIEEENDLLDEGFNCNFKKISVKHIKTFENWCTSLNLNMEDFRRYSFF